LNISQVVPDAEVDLENVNKISELFPSPSQKEKVLEYLKSRAPSLHDTVVARLQLESTDAKRIGSDITSTDTHSTPDKSTPLWSSVSSAASSPSLTSPESTTSPPHKVNVEVVLSNGNRIDSGEQVFVQEYFVEYSSLIIPSKVRRVNSTGESSPNADELHGIDHVLEDMRQKQSLRIQKSRAMNELIEMVACREELETTKTTEDLSRRGMALVHKFRARRKATLQAKYLQQTEERNLHEDATIVSRSHSKSPTDDARPSHSISDSPEDLEAYLWGKQSTDSSSGGSLLEERKLRLRALKEKRRRALMSNQKHNESRESLLRDGQFYQTSQVNALGDDLTENGNLDDTSLVSRVSPFKSKVFSRTKHHDASYEVLKAASPAKSFGSGVDSTSSSSTSGKRKNKKYGRKLFGNELKSHDLRRIIAPQSPEGVLSPIRGYQVSDVSSISSNIKIPTIFEDRNSTGEEHLFTSSTESSDAWYAGDLSFQSDANFFTESSKSCFSKVKQWPKVLKVNNGENQDPVVPHESDKEQCSTKEAKPAFNDSFDEIVFRQTPSQKVLIVDPSAEGESSSPTGVADMFGTQHQVFSPSVPKPETNNGGGGHCDELTSGKKPVDLDFIDEEERDLVFVDRDQSSDSLSPSPSEGSLLEPVFLSKQMFEI
jgi:hypothetical protein